MAIKSFPDECYLCGGTEMEHLPYKMRYKTKSRPWKCLGCGLVFLHPMMTPDEEARYYETGYARIYVEEKGTTLTELSKVRRKDAEMYYDWIDGAMSPGANCLEVGCASGYFLELLRSKRYRVAGVEPHVELSAMCKQNGMHMMRSIDDAGSRTFDYIFAFFLLEHLADPIRFLRRASEVCVHKGKIFIVVPNVQDALLSAYDIPAFRDFYFTPAHQFYYSLATLSNLLMKAGLPQHLIHPKQRYDLSNHMHWMMHGKPGGTGKYVDVTGTHANELYQECLMDKFLCDTLLAVVEVP